MLDTTKVEGTTGTRSLRPLDYVPAAVPLTRRGDAAIAYCRLRRLFLSLDFEDLAWAAAALRGLAREVDDVTCR